MKSTDVENGKTIIRSMYCLLRLHDGEMTLHRDRGLSKSVAYLQVVKASSL